MGMIENSSSCLQSMKLILGSTEKSDATSVAPAYAATGQNIRGASNRSWPRMMRRNQRTPLQVRSTCEAAIENGSSATNASSA